MRIPVSCFFFLALIAAVPALPARAQKARVSHAQAVARAKAMPSLRVGLHLVLRVVGEDDRHETETSYAPRSSISTGGRGDCMANAVRVRAR